MTLYDEKVAYNDKNTYFAILYSRFQVIRSPQESLNLRWTEVFQCEEIAPDEGAGLSKVT